ncbi:MAG TPA: M12 family metallopeptidase, partial [Verrucomicrobiae bacterium]|nr:M12 family metallopeptidase [Verrucomicrobiae bacterium]
MKQSEGVSWFRAFSRRRAGDFMGTASGLWLVVTTQVFAGNFYAGISPANVPWPGGIVPYAFTNTLTVAEQQTYLNGLREWELAANVQFIPRTTQTHWILFTYNTNGFDNVSASTNPQVVSVASLSRAQVCHEMGHSFGFTHENIRPDAANYIAVLTNNIADEPTNIYWFTVDPTTVTNGPYDFESVMHLGWDFDSSNRGVLATQQPRPPYFPRYEFRLGNYCLSPGDRAALAYLYGPPAVPLTNVVTTTADVGPGSLRAAIYYATDHPGTIIRFDIPTSDPGYSNGVFNIHLTGMLPPLAANGTVIDGSTQPGFTDQPVIFVDGSQILPETFTADTFLIYSANNQIENLSFSGFDWNGLTLEYADATNNTLSGCWFGLDATGTNAAPNVYQGIFLAAGASGNLIGGTNALERNVISGNSQYGVFISDSDTTGNRIFGNYIGTDFSGSSAAPNGKSGVFIGNASSGNYVGLTALVRNIISGNSEYGIYLTDSNTTGNRISGNYIGTDFSGSNAVPNAKSGVFIGNGAGGTYIGGTAGPVTQNVISGNAEYGVDLENTVSNVILGNYLGLNAGGSASLGNTLAGVGILAGAQNNLIGGS